MINGTDMMTPLKRRLIRDAIDAASYQPRIERRAVWPWVILSFALGLSVGSLL